jgi:hypothetical protein
MSQHAESGIALHVGSGGLGLFAGLALFVALHAPPLAEVGLVTGAVGGLFLAARSAFNAVCRGKGREAQELIRGLESSIAHLQETRRPLTQPAVVAEESAAEIHLRSST